MIAALRNLFRKISRTPYWFSGRNIPQFRRHSRKWFCPYLDNFSYDLFMLCSEVDILFLKVVMFSPFFVKQLFAGYRSRRLEIQILRFIDLNLRKLCLW